VEVQARNPQFRVRVVTRRFGEITDAELRGSVIQFSADRNFGQEAGTFNLTLIPKTPPQRFGVASWQDAIEAMDYVELWAWVPPRQPDRPLMRGFIDTIGESFDIQSGTPQHSISIAGRDFGKLALITKLYYTKEQEPESLTIIKKWTEGFDRLMQVGEGRVGELAPEASEFLRATQIMDVIFSEFITPQVDAVTDTFRAFASALPNPIMKLDMEGIDGSTESKLATYNPMFSQQNTRALIDVWALMRSFQHSPWRELFFDEDPEGPVLRYRDTPWLDFDGNEITPFAPSVQTVDVSLRDRMEWSLFRSDEKVVNFLFTLPANFSAFAQMAETTGPLEGVYAQPTFQSNPYLIGFDLRNDPEGIGTGKDADLEKSAFQRHGIRQRKFSTQYIDIDNKSPQKKIREMVADARDMGKEQNLLLKRAFDHGALLEFGSLSVRGDERLRLGNYLRFTETGARYYVTGLSQAFKQGSAPNDGRFISSMAVERGRGYLVRTKQAAG
jgi:hypothetical protein